MSEALTTPQMDRITDHARDAATAAASWVFDGNTDTRTYLMCIQMDEQGDPEWDDRFGAPAPLSGEWADGLTMSELYDIARIDEDDDPEGWTLNELAALYEDAYYERYHEDVLHTAHEMTRASA